MISLLLNRAQNVSDYSLLATGDPGRSAVSLFSIATPIPAISVWYRLAKLPYRRLAPSGLCIGVNNVVRCYCMSVLRSAHSADIDIAVAKHKLA